MQKNDAPCKGCPNRVPVPNCHTTCEKYLNSLEDYYKEKEIINTERKKYLEIQEATIKRQIAEKKRKGKYKR